MAMRWISYSVDEDRRRRRRGFLWWLWPWNWRRQPGYGRPHVVRIQPTRQRVRDYGDRRRRIWLWLLLLLLLLLFAILLGLLLLGEPEESDRAERTNSSGEAGTGSALDPGGVAPPVGAALALSQADDGSTMVTVPDRPSFRLDGDAKVMDLGDNSCHAQRYVLMTDGKAVPIDELDDDTVEALAQSDVPIDTVALSSGVDTNALQTIASRTGGTFTKME